MQLIKKKELLNIIGAYKGLLEKTKKVMLLRLNQFHPFMGLTDKSELVKIVHKPVSVNPYIVSPNFQPSMHDKVRQLSR